MKGLLVGLIAFVILVGGVLAFSTLQSIPNTMTIIESPPVLALQAYVEAEAITPIVNVYWDDRVQGSTIDWTFYVKNEGGVTFDLAVELGGDVSSWGSVTYIPNLSADFAPGDVVAINMLIDINSDAPLGAVDTFYTNLGSDS